MKITVNNIMSKEPCDDYSESDVEKLWGDNKYLTLCQICDLDISVDDRIWAVTRFLPDRENRLFAADCAESVLHLWTAKYPDDNRPALAIKAARDFTNGKIDAAARDAAGGAAWAAACGAACGAARAAARAAAWAADWAAARDAAWGVARAAARAAAWGVARAAAWAAAWAAARDAKEQGQIVLLRGFCEELEK